jgi:osmoprotectant transport system permease protein
MLNLIFSYFSRNSGKYWTAVTQHLGISALALGIACLFAFPLGIVCARDKRLKTTITGVFATLRIIPSLAVLFLCIPILGIGLKPALTALTFLAIPPILINTTLAFSSISPSVLETARGMGMSSRRIFFLVKIPLALPLVLTGFKTAAIEVIASATLVAYIGGGGLGTLIFTGMQLMRTEFLLIGGISVALLSVLTDYLLSFMETAVLKSLFGDVR